MFDFESIAILKTFLKKICQGRVVPKWKSGCCKPLLLRGWLESNARFSSPQKAKFCWLYKCLVLHSLHRLMKSCATQNKYFHPLLVVIYCEISWGTCVISEFLDDCKGTSPADWYMWASCWIMLRLSIRLIVSKMGRNSLSPKSIDTPINRRTPNTISLYSQF